MSRMTAKGIATVRQRCRAIRISAQANYAAGRAAVPGAAVPARISRRVPAGTLESEIRTATSDEPASGRSERAIRKISGRPSPQETLRRQAMSVGQEGTHRLLLPRLREREPQTQFGAISFPNTNRRSPSV